MNSSELPKISIVVPNYNGGETIGRTLQSLLDQNYPNLEIIVIDGGSTDNSLTVIQQYAPHLAYWMSEKDRGQCDAINKGIAKCSGDIVNWLCSDDVLNPGALHKVGTLFAESPQLDVLAGSCRTIYLDENSRAYVKRPTAKLVGLMPARNPIAQPSCFFRRRLLDRQPPVDESYYYAMDFELWNYFKSCGASWRCIDDELSTAYQSGQNKSGTGGSKVTFELERIYKTYVQEPIPLTFWHRQFRYPLEQILAQHGESVLKFPVGFLWLLVTLTLSPFYGFQRVWIMRWKRWV